MTYWVIEALMQWTYKVCTARIDIPSMAQDIISAILRFADEGSAKIKYEQGLDSITIEQCGTEQTKRIRAGRW